MRVAKRMAPGLDSKAMTAEIRERMTEELDYEHEAQNQRAFARAWRDHPFVVVPDVMSELSRERVLVSEYVEGIGFEAVKELDQASRDRYGEIVFRFFFGSLYRNGHFSGDPHPGNFLLMDDGRVAFLDFGMTRRLDRAEVDQEADAVRSGIEGDAEAFHANLAEIGYFSAAEERISPQRLLEHFHAITGWYSEPGEQTIDTDYVRSVMIDMGDPRSEYFDLARHATLPAQVMLLRRMETLVLGVLGQLRARADWHAIMREWLYGDPPATELGEIEATYLEGRSSMGRAVGL